MRPKKARVRSVAGAAVRVYSFSTKKQLFSGIVEDLNAKAKLAARKAYGFQTYQAAEIAFYHALGAIPVPETTHEFFCGGTKKGPYGPLLHIWRRGRDSNPRYGITVYTLSRRAPSATRTPLQFYYSVLPASQARSSQNRVRRLNYFGFQRNAWARFPTNFPCKFPSKARFSIVPYSLALPTHLHEEEKPAHTC